MAPSTGNLLHIGEAFYLPYFLLIDLAFLLDSANAPKLDLLLLDISPDINVSIVSNCTHMLVSTAYLLKRFVAVDLFGHQYIQVRALMAKDSVAGIAPRI